MFKLCGTVYRTRREEGQEFHRRYLGQIEKGDRNARQNTREAILIQNKVWQDLTSVSDVKYALRGRKIRALGANDVQYGNTKQLSDAKMHYVVRDFVEVCLLPRYLWTRYSAI